MLEDITMPHQILSAHPAPDKEIYARIGAVASEWSYMEILLANMLAHFCGAEHGAMLVITQTVANSSVVQWLRTLIEIKVKDLHSKDILLNLMNEVDDARTERNTLVHGAWYGDVNAGPGFAWVQTFRWDRAEAAKDEFYSASDIDSLIGEIQRLQGEIAQIGLMLGFLKA